MKNGTEASTLVPFCRDSIVLLFLAMSATITLYHIDALKGKKFKSFHHFNTNKHSGLKRCIIS